MAKVINCECGYTVRGENDEELLAQAHKHIDEAHPDIAVQQKVTHVVPTVVSISGRHDFTDS